MRSERSDGRSERSERIERSGRSERSERRGRNGRREKNGHWELGAGWGYGTYPKNVRTYVASNVDGSVHGTLFALFTISLIFCLVLCQHAPALPDHRHLSFRHN